MIGQTKVLDYFKTQVKNGQLKGFYIIQGAGRSGKTRLVKEISSMTKMPIQMITKPKVDDIRGLIDKCQTLSVPTIFCIDKADYMNMGSQNALLKLLEEPPTKAHIFIEITDMGNVLPTIKSRALTMELAPYTFNELCEATDNPELLDICDNVGQIKDFEMMDYKGLQSFVKKIGDNIGQITIMNVFNIAKYVAFKDGEDGFNLEMVMGALQREFKDDYEKGKIIAKHRKQMRHVSINKRNSFEMMLVKLWEDERK